MSSLDRANLTVSLEAVIPAPDGRSWTVVVQRTSDWKGSPYAGGYGNAVLLTRLVRVIRRDKRWTVLVSSDGRDQRSRIVSGSRDDAIAAGVTVCDDIRAGRPPFASLDSWTGGVSDGGGR